jgi:hypothetical protein
MTFARSSAARKSVPKPDRKAKFYFLHGDDEAAIERYKSEIVALHLTAEEREENYREISPSGVQATLKRVMGDVLSELATVSFLPKTKRVVTLYSVQDFFDGRAAKTSKAKGRGAKKADAPAKRPLSEHFAEFIEKDLPQLPAVLIIAVVEDYERWRKVSPSNPVMQLAQKLGVQREFRQTGPQFAFFDALFARKTAESLQLWRDWLERTSNSPKPYFQLATQMRLILQAKTATSGQLQSRGISRQRFETEFMPAEPDKNLFALRPEFRQEKLLRAASNFTFTELLSAYERLEMLMKYVIPLASDVYVPDKGLLAELWITELTAGRDGP